MSRLLTVWLVPLAFAIATPGTAQHDVAQSRAVYEAVLDSIRDSGREAFFVATQTAALTPTDRWQKALRIHSALPSELAQRLVALNDSSFALSAGSADSLSTAPVDSLLSDRTIGTTWRIVFSRVAFSEDESTALVYVAQFCGGRCGGASIVRLRREEERWRIDHWEHLMRF